MARAEANAAYYDIAEQRLRIAEATRLAYFEYFLAHRQLAVLEESTALLRSFREIALRKFESASAEQQDVLLADVELAQLERQRLSLTRAERVARARINTLLLNPPDSPLPEPPADLEARDDLPSSGELIDQALAQRPELAAQAARIRRERYAAALAHREFLPDLELVGRYDAFWQEEELRPMVGMNVNVPIYTRKRWAALREANARRAQQEATLESQSNEISFEIERAYQQVRESAETVTVFQERILPAARHSVEAAQASYTAGRLDFLRLVESQRQAVELENGYYDAVAEYHIRRAELRRQVAEAE
jgi:outer membrane protein TolC